MTIHSYTSNRNQDEHIPFSQPIMMINRKNVGLAL